MNSNQRPTTRYKVALTLGFLAVAAAIVAAYRQPATGYELSLYGATPIGFWIGVSVALLASIAVLVSIPEEQTLTNVALGLGTFSVMSIVGLPVLRSYEYYGAGDALTHLSWSREIRAGILNPLEFLYPAIHLIGNFMAEIAGVPLTRGLVVIPTVLFPLVSLVFFGLCVSVATDNRWGFTVGMLTAMLFVPINKISVHTVTHPSSQTILFVPVALYLLFRHLRSDVEGGLFGSSFGRLFALVTVGMIFLHPQESMNFLVLLGGVFVAQLFARRTNPYHPVSKHRPVGAHVMLMGVTFFAWVVRNDRARNRILYIVESLVAGTEDTAGGGTDARAASLVQLGGSIEEMFFKLFGVTLLFCLIAGLVSLYAFKERFRESSPSDPIVGYLSVGLVPLTLIFLVVFFADQGDHYFRFLGFIMMPVTLLGAIGLTRLVANVDKRVDRAQVTAVLGVVFVVLLALSLVTVHSGPYIYQGNAQVTDHALEGHHTAFEHHDGEAPVLGIRQGQYRFIDVQFGQTTVRGQMNFPGYREGIHEDIFNDNLTTHYDEDIYVVLQDDHYLREVHLYEELRYTQEGFDQFEREPEINRVQDNGEFRLYRVAGD